MAFYGIGPAGLVYGRDHAERGRVRTLQGFEVLGPEGAVLCSAPAPSRRQRRSPGAVLHVHALV